MMTTQIADRLVELCRKGRFEQAQTELFADDAVSIEPDGAPVELAEGLDAILDKGREFMRGVGAMHRIEVSEPIVADSFFTVSMALDTTMKDRRRIRMEELCVYEVEEDRLERLQSLNARKW
jgi:hypothetical protein